ncbi:MAG: hypothetical protein EA351_02525 [Gemmatimonadales bacterium]|nr:MAG: hypothetical protein EA351_02525 [Gemmatimonadales bacterium]
MDDAWIIFLEELRDRGEDIPQQEVNRGEDMAEAVHETFQATTDRLHLQENWKESRARRITKGFVKIATAWIKDAEAEGVMDWDDLAERLELFQQDWDSEFGTSLV